MSSPVAHASMGGNDLLESLLSRVGLRLRYRPLAIRWVVTMLFKSIGTPADRLVEGGGADAYRRLSNRA